MRKLHLTLAALAAAAALGVGAVVALAQESPQRTPTSETQERANAGPTAAGTERPAAPAKPTPEPAVRPSNPQTAAG